MSEEEIMEIIDSTTEKLAPTERVVLIRGLIVSLELRWEAELHPERFGCDHLSTHHAWPGGCIVIGCACTLGGSTCGALQ